MRIRKSVVAILSLFLVSSFTSVSMAQNEYETAEEYARTAESAYVQVYKEEAAGTPQPGADSSPLPLTNNVLVFETDEQAQTQLEFLIDSWLSEGLTLQEVPNLGTEAVGFSAEGETVIWMVLARQDNVLVASFGGVSDEYGMAEPAVHHILEHGPSDTPAETDEDGVVTGGWADAFPQPEDIEGLGHLKPADVRHLFEDGAI